MTETTQQIIIVFGVLVFAGFWVWFLYTIFHAFAENYEKKPLKYVSVKNQNLENDKIKYKNNMAKKSFFGYFKNLYEGRITRSVWFFGLILLIVVFIVSFGVLVFLMEEIPALSPIFGILMILIIIYYIIHIFSLHARRLHDLGYSDWMFLLIFVPIANLILFSSFAFIKGEEKANRFGEPVGDIKFLDAFFNKQSSAFVNSSEVENSKLYCSKCGSLIEGDSNFCIKCGNKIN